MRECHLITQSEKLGDLSLHRPATGLLDLQLAAQAPNNERLSAHLRCQDAIFTELEQRLQASCRCIVQRADFTRVHSSCCFQTDPV